MNIIFLGAPGSGKGTQAKNLVSRRNFIQLSTGDLFREEILKKSELGLKVKEIIDSGKLVNDEVVLEVINNKLKQISDNIIFDGFPRTIDQAEGLEKILQKYSKEINLVLFFEINENEVIKRLSSRRFCPKCGKIYNLITNPPKKEGICDECNTSLSQRDDDKPEVIKKRIEVYKDLTSPLISYYRTQEIFYIIDASKNDQEVYEQIEKIIKQK